MDFIQTTLYSQIPNLKLVFSDHRLLRCRRKVRIPSNRRPAKPIQYILHTIDTPETVSTPKSQQSTNAQSWYFRKRSNGYLTLINDGFSFNRYRKADKNVYWRCSRSINSKCRARLSLENNVLTMKNGDHNEACRRMKPYNCSGAIVKITQLNWIGDLVYIALDLSIDLCIFVTTLWNKN